MKEIYQNMNAQIHPDEMLVQKVLHMSVRKQHNRKGFAVCLACTVLSIGSVSVLTHASEDFRDALYTISPRAGAVFSPVMKSCVSQGIEMTVEGIHIHDDDAEFYITFKDTEGDRINQTLDLFDSYSIVRPFAFDGSAYGCSKTGYDEETGKVRFYISTHELHAGKFWGDSLTFSVKTLLTNVDRQEHVPVEIDLSDVNYQPQIVSGAEFFSSRGYGSSGKYLPDPEKCNIMKPEYQKEFLQEFKLTGLAWENGYLHIQNCIEHWNGNSSIFYSLIDEAGNELEEEFSFNWKDGGTEYFESFFVIQPEEISKYQVYASYRIGGTFIDGNWKVKFPLESTD